MRLVRRACEVHQPCKLYRLEVVNSFEGGYDSPRPVAVEDRQPNAMEVAFSNFVSGKGQSPYPAAQKIIDDAAREKEGLAMGVHERILQSGMLSKSASYRVIVSGHMGAAEFDKLIAKLEMDRDILTEPDPPHTMPKGYGDHDADSPDA